MKSCTKKNLLVVIEYGIEVSVEIYGPFGGNTVVMVRVYCVPGDKFCRDPPLALAGMSPPLTAGLSLILYVTPVNP